MAKKQAKRAKRQVKKVKKSTLIENLPKSKKEHLELLLFYTERVITDTKTELDKIMQNQAERLKAQIKAL